MGGGLLGCASAQTAADAAAPLRRQARPAGRSFGAAIRSEILSTDPAYAALFAAECELLTPEWEAKWEALQPEEGRYDFAPLDPLIGFAQANQQRLRGHALIWHEAMPAWLAIALREDASRARGVLEAHFNAVLTHTRATIRDWDVVNEPIANPPGSDQPQAGDNILRESPWFRALGRDYIEIALRWARAHDPTLRLTINEYGVEEATPDAAIKRQRLLALLRHLLDRGCPLDAVGIQAHLQLRRPFDPELFMRFVAELRGMGLAVLITELDIREGDQLPPSIPARDAAVAERTAAFISAAIAAGCRNVITWGLSDRDSWLVKEPGVARPDGVTTRGLPFDEALQRKPMWHALAAALR
jgi:endo-1,4-beta-xylanase